MFLFSPVFGAKKYSYHYCHNEFLKLYLRSSQCLDVQENRDREKCFMGWDAQTIILAKQGCVAFYDWYKHLLVTSELIKFNSDSFNNLGCHSYISDLKSEMTKCLEIEEGRKRSHCFEKNLTFLSEKYQCRYLSYFLQKNIQWQEVHDYQTAMIGVQPICERVATSYQAMAEKHCFPLETQKLQDQCLMRYENYYLSRHLRCNVEIAQQKRSFHSNIIQKFQEKIAKPLQDCRKILAVYHSEFAVCLQVKLQQSRNQCFSKLLQQINLEHPHCSKVTADYEHQFGLSEWLLYGEHTSMLAKKCHATVTAEKQLLDSALTIPVRELRELRLINLFKERLSGLETDCLPALLMLFQFYNDIQKVKHFEQYHDIVNDAQPPVDHIPVQEYVFSSDYELCKSYLRWFLDYGLKLAKHPVESYLEKNYALLKAIAEDQQYKLCGADYLRTVREQIMNRKVTKKLKSCDDLKTSTFNKEVNLCKNKKLISTRINCLHKIRRHHNDTAQGCGDELLSHFIRQTFETYVNEFSEPKKRKRHATQ